MTVRVVGEGPAVAALEAALTDVDADVERGAPEDFDDATLGVVVAPAGDERFASAVAHADEWIAIELGGVGGRAVPGVEAAISGYRTGGVCYHCLEQRVAANADDGGDVPDVDSDAPVDDPVARLAGATAGREAARLLAGDDRVTGRVLELPHSRRAVLPVPGCSCAGEGPASLAETRSLPIPRAYADRPLEETVGRMERAVDERVGIVSQVGEVASFPAAYYLATLAETDAFSDGTVPTNAAGVDNDWNAALLKALGESLERYAAAVYRSESFERAVPTELDSVVPPTAFAGAPESAPGADAEEALPWVRAESLSSDERAWLPASAVHFPPPPERSVPGITTGLGLGSSPVGALLAGLTEVIERDATMLAWYSTFEPLGLAVTDERFERLARRARGEGLTVTPLLVTQDVDVPVVAVAVHREDEWPQFAVASAAALDPVEAATGALVEAIQNWMELRSTGQEAAADLSAAIGEYASFPEPARDLVDVDSTVEATEVGPADPPTGEAALDAMVDELAESGLEAYAARLTTPDLDELGFEAVRVAVPEAQPLFTGTGRFGERARTVPEAMGFEPRLDREHHPYP